MSQSTNRAIWLWPGVALTTAAAVFVACGNINDPGSTVPGQCQMEAPLVRAVQTDILFVIDNSGSMTEEQAAVATELPAFIQALESGGGIVQDFRVGVITTSVYQQGQLPDGGTTFREYTAQGQSGRLQAVPDAGDRVLAKGDPALIEKFTRLVQVGVNGSGQETPFEAVRLALSPPLIDEPVASGGMQGFLRDGARLLVAVVSDEDDCSEFTTDGGTVDVAIGQAPNVDWCGNQSDRLNSTRDYYQFFTNLRGADGGHREVLWAAIAPVGRADKAVGAEVDDGGVLRNVDCPTSFQPGHRHREMAELFQSDLQNLDSICKASYRDSLIAIADLANSINTLEVMNIPDPELLVISITRANGEVDHCTLLNGGITFEAPTADRAARVHFQGQCRRDASDTKVEVKLLCAG